MFTLSNATFTINHYNNSSSYTEQKLTKKKTPEKLPKTYTAAAVTFASFVTRVESYHRNAIQRLVNARSGSVRIHLRRDGS